MFMKLMPCTNTFSFKNKNKSLKIIFKQKQRVQV